MNVGAWVLILFVHVGPMGKTDSNSTTSVPGFESRALCEQAGTTAKGLVRGTVKNLEFVCVPTR